MGGSQNTITNSTVEDWIVGTWDWKETIIVSRGVPPPITPQSAGYTEQWKFLPDGQLEFHKDGDLIDTYPYRTESYRLGPKVTPATPASTERYCRLYIVEKTHKVGSAAGVQRFPSYTDCTITSETLTSGTVVEVQSAESSPFS
jgi:hypothetical protein